MGLSAELEKRLDCGLLLQGDLAPVRCSPLPAGGRREEAEEEDEEGMVRCQP